MQGNGGEHTSLLSVNQGVEDKEVGIPGLPLYHIALSTLIFKALLD